ncbi:MAG: UDP-glucose 4-epimerase GalE [Negativicutes bacterium]|jgi:UDP-glucose 4-epimerase
MNILVVGGAGYIGSHTAKLLSEHQHNVVIYDNLSKGHSEAVEGFTLVVGDIFDEQLLIATIRKYQIKAVVHFAAFIQVGESVTDPQQYYRNNVVGTLSLLNALLATNVKQLVFSSTAAVFGEPERVPITEDVAKIQTNPYGRTKWIMEQAMSDYSRAYGLRFVALRYFNACGADPDGCIGEDHDPESHLIPLVLFAASGERSSIKIFGDDYPTADGTCVRDYIHVNDLALAHMLALEYLQHGGQSTAYNLGVGNGFSVKEIIDAAERVTKLPIKREYIPRREGDPAVLVADSAKIRAELGWEPEYADVEDIIRTAWNWHSKHPNGFQR